MMPLLAGIVVFVQMFYIEDVLSDKAEKVKSKKVKGKSEEFEDKIADDNKL